MIDMRYKPYFLPQVDAPHEYVMEKLNEEGIESELVDIDPNELNPMQGIVFADEVPPYGVEDIKPGWISKDNDVVDGHHRYISALNAEKPMKCVKVGLNGKDAARVLNKIQDIYDYEQQAGTEDVDEVVAQDVINDKNKGLNIQDPEGTEEFLTKLKSTTDDYLSELDNITAPQGDGCKVIAYRGKPILENSVIGNFFILTPQQGYDKYEIDFENLLDTNELALDLTGRNPIDTLAKNWFPHVDFNNVSAPYNHTPEQLKNKAIAEKARKMGYDGIKYGDLMIQGLK